MDRKRIIVHHMACQITRPNTTWFFPVGGGVAKDQVYRTPVSDFADLQEKIYAAVNNVTPQMIHNIWVEVEYRLNISRATNVSYVDVYGT